ncbi:MAG: threonylcarbamoyl-AMP synthase [Desulfarculaceae bacterium]|nr:threonylcarbamoyl-AMP synthase [Desulfarculaceae bacterium]
MPTVYAIDPRRPDPALLERAAGLLARGGLAVLPTETFYGLAVDAANPEALSRLAGLKGREQGKAFGLILARPEEAARLGAQVSPQARALMARHWPGPLTLVLAARPGLHPRLALEGGGGMRLSPHPVAAGLARALGRAITATSANPAGGPAPASLAELDPAIVAGADLILDAGPTPGGPASTVADARGRGIRVLRPGAVALDPADRPA